MNRQLNALLPVILICTTVILTAFVFSRTGIYIKSLAGVESGGKISNTISVTGDGKVNAIPDMVELSMGFSEIAPKSRDAMDKVNQKIKQATDILKQNGIPDKDITTTNLSIYTEYDYSGSVRRVIGQRASQSLEVTIRGVDAKASKPSKIIDELSAIDNVQMNSINFDIEDKTKLFSQAREAAFKKAKQKAEELAKLSGVKLMKPVSISDATYDVAPPAYLNSYKTARDQAMPVTGGGSSISTGSMDISANLSILWGIE